VSTVLGLMGFLFRSVYIAGLLSLHYSFGIVLLPLPLIVAGWRPDEAWLDL
jgi:hypothetical protein